MIFDSLLIEASLILLEIIETPAKMLSAQMEQILKYLLRISTILKNFHLYSFLIQSSNEEIKNFLEEFLSGKKQFLKNGKSYFTNEDSPSLKYNMNILYLKFIKVFSEGTIFKN